jgi:3D (Asp-Asp-Asp) domain-containing protein
MRVQAAVSAWRLTDRGIAVAGRVRALRPGQLVVLGALVASIAVPTVFYGHERARRLELQRAYRTLTTGSTAEISVLRRQMGDLIAEQAELRELLFDAGYAVYSENELAIPVVATGYSSTVIETDDTPFITAWNTPTRDGVLALSRDLLRRYTPAAPFDFGDTVVITGIGEFMVEDSMHPRWRRRVDIWFASRTEAFRFGRREVILRATFEDRSRARETALFYTEPLGVAVGPGATGGAAP